MILAFSKSSMARPYSWRLIDLWRLTVPSTCPLYHGLEIAAATASSSASTPAAKAASLLLVAVAIHGSRRASSLERIFAWKRSRTSRAATSAGTVRSIKAFTIAVCAEPVSRSVVMLRATVRALIEAAAAWPSFSSRRRRVAHSLTTRSEPAKPDAFSRRHSSAPTRHPAFHSASSASDQASSELWRLLNVS